MRLSLLVLAMALVVCVIAFGPLALIWALNVLFGLALPYTLKTWAAALILGGLFGCSSARSKP